MNKIELWHPNGYRGMLYGKSSLIITDSNGEEVIHTDSRTINTEKELYQLLEKVPDLLQHFDAIYDDGEGE